VCYWNRANCYPSICHWVFKDEEVSVLHPVPCVQIMECSAESKSEKNIRSLREGERNELRPHSLPHPSVFFLLTPHGAVPTIWTPETVYLPLY